MSAGDSTLPSRHVPGLQPIERPELREAVWLLGEMMSALGETHLAEVCYRALEGHGSEVLRAGSAIASALRLLRPGWPGGSG